MRVSKRVRLEAALRYARLGWALLPLEPRSKLPYAALLPPDKQGNPSWSQLAKRPASEAEIRAWFKDDPQCNIGVILGQPSGGLVVADFDHSFPRVPLTPIVETHRGLHAYFQAEGEMRCRKLPWGEFKGDGGYVVLPPSIHPDGTRYEWSPELAPWQVDLAPFPAGLIDDHPRIFQPPPAQGGSAGVARNNVSRFRGPDGGLEEKATGLARLMCDPEVVLRVLRYRGCDVERVGQSFLCPVPGHEEKHPSASLWHAEGMPIRLHCFHDDQWWFVPDLYAAMVTGKVRELGGGERAIWTIRALHEAGVVTAARVRAEPLPTGARESTRKVYEGFCYLLSLRSLYDADQVGTPFTWRFAAHWCGIGSPGTVQKAMKQLLGLGYLRQVQEGKSGQEGRRSAGLFALGTPRGR